MAVFANRVRLAAIVVAGQTIRLASRLAERMLASKPGGLNGRNLWSLIAPEEKAAPRRDRLGRASRSRTPWHFEAAGSRLDGVRIWVDVRLSPCEWEGKPAWLALLTDISTRKRAEAALRESEQRYRHLVESSSQGIVVVRQGRIRMANRAFAAIFGIEHPAGVPPGTGFTSFLAPHERTRFHDLHPSELAGSARPERSEYEGRRADGSAVWIEALAAPVDWEGEPAILLTVADITDRHRAGEELRASERLLRSVFDAMPVEITVKDPAQRYAMANRASLERFRVSEPDLIGRTAEEAGVLPAELSRQVRAADSDALATGKPVEIPENGVVLDGVPRVHRILKVPFLDEQGRAEGIVTLCEDITERNRAEQALREQQRLLESAQAVGRIGTWTADVGVTGSLRGSDEAYRIYGGSREGLDGRVETILAVVHPDDQAGARAAMRRAIKEGSVYEHEHRILRPDRTIRWVHQRAEVQRDNRGRATRVVGFIQDITERKEAELALAANERLLQAVLDAIPHNVFVKDRNGRIVLANRAHTRFWGTSGSDATVDPAELAGISPEMAGQWNESDRLVLETGRTVEWEGDLVRTASGNKAWLRWIKVPRRDENDRIVGLVGVSEDITPRVQAETALRTQQRLLQAVFDTIPQQLFVKDTQSRYVLVNRAFAGFYGLTPSQLHGMPSSELPGVSRDEAESWLEQDRQIVETGEPVLLPEIRRTNPWGGEVWFELRKYPWRDDKNKVIGVVGVREDISARMHTSELVRANRRLLRTVFDTIPHLLYVKDTNGRYIMVNQAMADVYGQTPEAMAGTYTLDMPDALPEQRQDLLDADRMVVESGTPIFRPEVPLFEGPRGTRWYAITKLPLRNEEGKIIGLVGMSEDITERRRAELEHRMDRRLLRAVFDAVPFWLMVRDTSGRATLANRCMARDYGVEPDAFLGKVLEADPSLKPAEKAAMQAMTEEVERTLQPVTVPEMPVTLPGGVVRLMRLVVIPLFDDAGKREGALILAEDITERKRSEDALLQAQKLESLGVLAGGIAHDFNNLLVAVLGNASLALLKLQEDAPCREELRQIELAGQRAAELCRQMLAYAGKGPLEMQRIAVNGLVREMAQLLKVSLPKGAAIQFRLTQELPAVEGDPTQLRQVVMNLVINAGEAIGDKQGVITLTTGTQDADQAYLSNCQSAPDARPGRYVFVEVSDTGHGMTPATLSRIFDPFFTTKFAGRGLGLASVIGIMRGHRGALRVYSEPGVGSAFRLLLPMAGPASGLQEGAPGPRPWAAGGEVLLVDDEADIRAVGEKMLTYLGFTVVQAADGQEAIEALRAHPAPFLAALVDLTMPGMTGEEVVRELRRFQDLPVLVMSGYHERDVQNRFIGRKKTEFLQKPFTLSSLHAKMRALLGDPVDG